MKQDVASLAAEVAVLDGGDAVTSASPESAAEQRSAPRFTVLLRTARLIADGREYICVLRDISATGVKIRLFHAVPDCARLQLELDGGKRYDMSVVWTADGHAGLRFADSVDVAAVIEAQNSGHPRRQLRINVDRPAQVLLGREEVTARLTNVSQQGACIEIERRLCLRERLRIACEQMPQRTATVCWRDQPRYGLVFEQGFKLDELARLVERLHDRVATPLPHALAVNSAHS